MPLHRQLSPVEDEVPILAQYAFGAGSQVETSVAVDELGHRVVHRYSCKPVIDVAGRFASALGSIHLVRNGFAQAAARGVTLSRNLFLAAFALADSGGQSDPRI